MNGILMKPAKIQAVAEGRKTVMRRRMNPQPTEGTIGLIQHVECSVCGRISNWSKGWMAYYDIGLEKWYYLCAECQQKQKKEKQMENEKEMRERHKKEIEALQVECPHMAISDWMDYYWAPGHYSHQVKVCKKCGKTMNKRGRPSTPGIEATEASTTEANDYYLRDYIVDASKEDR